MLGDTADREIPFQRATMVAGTSGRLDREPKLTLIRTRDERPPTMALEESDHPLPHGAPLPDDLGHVAILRCELIADRCPDVFGEPMNHENVTLIQAFVPSRSR